MNSQTQRWLVLLVFLCSIVAPPLALASSLFVQNWRSVSLVSTDGDIVEIRPGGGRLEISVTIDGRKYAVTENPPPDLPIEPGSVMVQFHSVPSSDGRFEKMRVITFSLVTDRFGEKEDSVIETWEYLILPSVGVCGFERRDAVGSTVESKQSCR